MHLAHACCTCVSSVIPMYPSHAAIERSHPIHVALCVLRRFHSIGGLGGMWASLTAPRTRCCLAEGPSLGGTAVGILVAA